MVDHFRARWPRMSVEEHPAFSPLVYPARPLAGTLMPETVPAPPAAEISRGRTTLAIVGTAAASIAVVAITAVIFAARHGLLG